MLNRKESINDKSKSEQRKGAVSPIRCKWEPAEK